MIYRLKYAKSESNFDADFEHPTLRDKPWGLFSLSLFFFPSFFLSPYTISFFPFKSLNIFVAFILFYQPLKVLPWKKIHKLHEYISTLIHNSLEFVDAYEL